MTKLVYFLGAGAAQPCGYPTTPELYQALYGERADLALFQKFGDALSDYSKAEPIDIEVLYDLVSQKVGGLTSSVYERFDANSIGDQLLLGMLRRHSGWGDTLMELQEAFKECLDAILDFIREKFWKVKPDLSPYEKLQLFPATSELGTPNVLIFTTNYDVSLEDYFGDVVPYNCGIAGGTLSHQELAFGDPERIKLVKLHGSIDLYRLASGRIVHISAYQGPGPWKGGEEIVGPYLVPPQIGKIDYDEAQLNLFDFFEMHVKDADAVTIIGTSFRDKQVTDVLKSAPKDSNILVACGSKSNMYSEKFFGEHEKVTPVKAHFPDHKIEEWLQMQIYRREIDQDGNLVPKKDRWKDKGV